jgi:hypothetical protein
VQDVERHERRRASGTIDSPGGARQAGSQRAEVRPAVVVQTHKLAVEDHRPAAKDVCDLHELGKLIGAVATGP